MSPFKKTPYSFTLRKSVFVSLSLIGYGMLVYAIYNYNRMTPEDHAILNACTEKPLSAIAHSRSRVSLTAPLAGKEYLFKLSSC